MSLAAMTAALLIVPATASAAPRAVIESAPPERTTDTAATFGFAASEPPPLLGLARPPAYECRLDGGAWGACASPTTYSGLLGGSHTFEVRAAGLLDDRTPAAWTWAIELVTESLPPVVNPVHPPAPPRRPAKPRPRKRRDAGGCPYAANFAREVAARRLEGAVICLLNRARARRGLPALRRNAALRRAAVLHSLDMWRFKYFTHVSRGGATALQRVLRAGYFAPRQFGAVGEVLAWGDGRYGTPRASVAGLMRSRPHRKVILTGAFRDVGVGVAPGVPRRNRGRGLTVAAVLGRRG